MVPILRPTKIRYYVNVMNSRGYKPREVLTGSGITEAHLADPALLVDSRQCDIVVRNMLQLTRNPALGLDIGGSVRLADFGVLAHAMMSSRTLGEAMNLAVRFYNLMGTRIQLGFEPSADGGAMTVCDTLDARDPVRQFYVEEIVMLGNRLGEDLINAPYRLSGCTFAYPPPPHANLYAERLQSKVEFDAPRNCFIKSASLLETPLRGSDPEFNEICLRQCTKIMRQISEDGSIVVQLRSLILSQITALPSLQVAAQELKMSSRSLRRHLQQENTTYQALVDTVRMELAVEYLKTERLLIKEISYLLGFSGSATFVRAFKSWTGMTVQEYRGQL